MNTIWGQSLGMWVRRHLSAPEPLPEPPKPVSCIDCGRVIPPEWRNTFYCPRCMRRNRTISLAKQAYYLSVGLDEVAATLLAGAVDRLERER